MRYIEPDKRHELIKKEIIKIVETEGMGSIGYIIEKVRKNHIHSRVIERGYTYTSVYRVLNQMVEDGDLVKQGPSANSTFKKWHISDKRKIYLTVNTSKKEKK